MVRALSSHQFGPGFKSQCQRHMWVEFVVGSLPCSERFFSGYSSKTNISKFQFDQQSGRRSTTEWMCYLQIVIFLFIRSFVRLLDLSLSTCSPYCPFFFFHYQAQKKERSTNVQKRIQASFSKLTMYVSLLTAL